MTQGFSSTKPHLLRGSHDILEATEDDKIIATERHPLSLDCMLSAVCGMSFLCSTWNTTTLSGSCLKTLAHERDLSIPFCPFGLVSVVSNQAHSLRFP